MRDFRIYDIVKPKDEWLEKEKPQLWRNLYEAVSGMKITENPKTYIGVVVMISNKNACVEWLDKNVSLHSAWWEIEELDILGNANDCVMNEIWKR